jgi:hypothetical protein
MVQIATAQEARDLEILMLEEFGKYFYKDKNVKNVQSLFQESRTTLQEIMAHLEADGQHIPFFSLLLKADGDVRPELAGKRLVRFNLVAQNGRRVISDQGYDPSFFVPLEMLLLATQAQQRLLHAHEVA